MLRKVIDQLNNLPAFRSEVLLVNRVNSAFQPKIIAAVAITNQTEKSALTKTAMAVIAIKVE